MVKKYNVLEAKCKDTCEYVDKWKHKATGLEGRLKEALKDKNTAEKAASDAKEERKTVEVERYSWKDKAGTLEEKFATTTADLETTKIELALYFDNGFERAKIQIKHFNPDV